MPGKKISTLVFMILCCISARALSFSLDSIAAWGKFPRFCVNTYYWGDRFFNGYDTTYVRGSGYKFNIKARSESWIDYYNFDLPQDMRMRMLSDPSSTMGFWLSYMAVSVGYDKNISKFFGGSDRSRELYSFGFNCSLFTFNLLYSNNDVGTKISKFGKRGETINPNLPFDGAHIKTFDCNLYYFFNHKQYSQAAAFNYGRVQHKSAGSWFAGLAYTRNHYSFDFRELPDYIKKAFPSNWIDSRYHAVVRDFCVKGGYGYNWVFARNWVMGSMIAPTMGMRKGFINSDFEKTTFAFAFEAKLSAVWNHKCWFAGIVTDVGADIVYDKESTFSTGIPSITISAGYRFNLW